MSIARQIILFGDMIEQPASKQRRSGSHDSDSMKTLVGSERYNVFKEAWKVKAPWPRLYCVDLPDHVRGTLLSTWFEYKVDDGMYCMLCTKWKRYLGGVLLLVFS